MFCTKCGKKLDSESVFCQFCGQKIGEPERENKPGTPKENLTKGVGSNVKMGHATNLAMMLHKKAILALMALLATIVVVVVGIKLVVNTSTTRNTLKEDADDEDDYEDEEESESDGISDTESEVKKEEPAREYAEPILQNYLDNVLAPQYGYADLGAKKLVLNPSSYTDYDQFYNQLGQYEAWTQINGIADARICDLDKDGADELLVTFVDAQNAGISVYEAEGNDVVKKAEIFERRSSDVNGYGIIWVMAEANEKKYLLWRDAHFAVWADGYEENVKMWQYDGRKLSVAMEILQTAGGSSDFEYTAYRYDENGGLLLEEIIGREYASEEGEAYPEDEAYRMRRMQELFGEYGIQAGSNALMYATKGELEAWASPDENCQALLVLDMNVDYQEEETVYRFNP